MGGSTRNLLPQWLIECKNTLVDNSKINKTIKLAFSLNNDSYVACDHENSTPDDTGASKHYFCPVDKRQLTGGWGNFKVIPLTPRI